MRAALSSWVVIGGVAQGCRHSRMTSVAGAGAGGASSGFVSALHAAICTARHGVGSAPKPSLTSCGASTVEDRAGYLASERSRPASRVILQV